jgi:putative sterol carrier protein
METETTTAADLLVPALRGAPELAGLSGRLRVRAGGRMVGVLRVDAGEVEMAPDDGTADATLLCASEADLDQILRGELNVVVAALQGRLAMEGDLQLAVKMVLSLSAAARNRAGQAGVPAKGG